MTPITPDAVQALAQQAAETPAHLDPLLVQQVCQEWLEQRPSSGAMVVALSKQLGVMKDALDKAESSLAAARAALQAVLEWGVEMDDTRLGYVVVQVDREAIAQVRAALGLTQGEGQTR